MKDIAVRLGLLNRKLRRGISGGYFVEIGLWSSDLEQKVGKSTDLLNSQRAKFEELEFSV
jgi:hypothetical protein